MSTTDTKSKIIGNYNIQTDVIGNNNKVFIIVISGNPRKFKVVKTITSSSAISYFKTITWELLKSSVYSHYLILGTQVGAYLLNNRGPPIV